MGQPRRSFTPEFKQEAVDLCRRTGKSGKLAVVIFFLSVKQLI
jgi:transposase-like protein